MMVTYEDLDLRIRADGDRFVTSARRGDQRASAPFEIDWSRSWDLWQPAERGPSEAKEIGSALFEALIRREVRDLYHQGRGGGGGQAERGLRLCIHLNPHEERVRPLIQLPWEVLCDPSGAGSLLALDPRRPIVRAIDSTAETLAPREGRLERVLLVLSEPRSQLLLDLDSECTEIEEQLARIQIRPTVLRGATRKSLLEAIRDGEHQIVHFLGHGDFDRTLLEGVLLLETESRGRDPFPASTHASLFLGKPMPWLVILSACKTSVFGSASNPFSSVAGALAGAGLPAVLAMQTAVRDRSSIRFSERLYQNLAKGNPVEEAVSEARHALNVAHPEAMDWAVPVLYVRGRAVTFDSGAYVLRDRPSSPEPGRAMEVRPLNVNNYGNVENQSNSSGYIGTQIISLGSSGTRKKGNDGRHRE